MKFSAIGLITILVSSVVALPARPGASNGTPPPNKGGTLTYSERMAIRKGLNPNP